MRTKLRKRVPPARGVGDQVTTPMGVGIVHYVFPGSGRYKTAYAVRFGNRRPGTIFNEDQVTLLDNARPR
jgi:hypothetical protein